MQDIRKVGRGGGLKDMKVGKLGEAELTKLKEANLPGKQRNTTERLALDLGVGTIRLPYLPGAYTDRIGLST